MSERGKSGAFESYARDPDQLKSSDRGFGRVMAVFLAIVGGFQAWHERPVIAGTLFAVAAAFALVAQVRPTALHRLNLLWFKLGLLLHHIVNPIVMTVIFYGAVVPTGLLMRLFGKRLMPTGFDRAAQTYWIARTPPGPPPESMKRQF
ncbi:hypothetical protein [Aquabacter spiritensis]|uniref:SxtJ n=1 Tax=Aquabacter spiritensis TaxID=933073 RepID=A0A4V2UY52_9HYPH|nr:hypothetical protein [Aquabacter spiritensis]TCT06058.1 hypothetical protein EDC64_103162 [Aquabacter spiritensis]